MSTNPFRHAQIHRFRDAVAAYMVGDDSRPGKHSATIYLAPVDARRYAAALVACADDIEARSFVESEFETVEFGPLPQGAPDPTEPEVPVIFRIDRDGVVTAIFPTEPHDRNGDLMACYAHVGQHAACDMGWYRNTKPAKPEEYAGLKRELEAAPYRYRLKICTRISASHKHAFSAAVRKASAS